MAVIRARSSVRLLGASKGCSDTARSSVRLLGASKGCSDTRTQLGPPTRCLQGVRLSENTAQPGQAALAKVAQMGKCSRSALSLRSRIAASTLGVGSTATVGKARSVRKSVVSPPGPQPQLRRAGQPAHHQPTFRRWRADAGHAPRLGDPGLGRRRGNGSGPRRLVDDVDARRDLEQNPASPRTGNDPVALARRLAIDAGPWTM